MTVKNHIVKQTKKRERNKSKMEKVDVKWVTFHLLISKQNSAVNIWFFSPLVHWHPVFLKGRLKAVNTCELLWMFFDSFRFFDSVLLDNLSKSWNNQNSKIKCYKPESNSLNASALKVVSSNPGMGVSHSKSFPVFKKILIKLVQNLNKTWIKTRTFRT
jgi:hypothetical protein